MDLKINETYNSAENCWLISIAGEIDIYNSEDFKVKLNSLLNQHQSDLLLDFTELDYIDSTGLGALVYALKKVKSFGGKIVLKNLKPNINKIIRITELDKIFILEGENNV